MHHRIVLLAAAALTSGCSYLQTRATDLAQSVHLGLGVSAWPGLEVHAVAPVFGATLGYLGDSVYVGTDHHYTHGWHHAALGFLVGGEVVRAEFGHSVAGYTRGDASRDTYLHLSQFMLVNFAVTDHRFESSGAIPLTRIEIGAHLLFVGASVGLDVAELLDFFTGLLTYDLLDDDDFEPRRAPFEPAATKTAAD